MIERMAAMGALTLFIIVTSAALAILTIMSMAVLFVLCRPRIAARAKDHSSNVVAAFAVVSLVIGTAASLGGALATINTADLGLKVAKLTEQRERTKFIEEKIDRSVFLYGSILEEMSQLYASQIYFEAGVASDHGSMFDRNNEVSLVSRAQHLHAHLVSLAGALRAAARDDFSATCFKKWWKLRENRIDFINKRAELGGESRDSSSIVSPKDLTDVAYLFERASDDASGGPDVIMTISDSRNPYVTRDLQGDRLDQGIEIDAYVKLGNLISNSYLHAPRFRALYGTAILHDLIKNLPRGSDIVTCFNEKYGEVGDGKSIDDIGFDPGSIVGEKLTSVIEAFDRNPDHYMKSR